ncbi:MAG: hypothetical protein SFU85_09190 [Candidatus Methylacidiphilales bacterium]|nr:hypothetical protein [Candidatus Methylacidiphilales bacterium]
MTDASPATGRPLRWLVYLIAAAQVAFFAYAAWRILAAPPGDGTGMRIVAFVPLGALLLIGVFPAISYARSNKPLVGLAFALFGFGATQWLWWTMLVNELRLT